MCINIYLCSVADNAFHNERTLDGLENFHLMGIIHSITRNVMLRGKISRRDIKTGELLRKDATDTA